MYGPNHSSFHQPSSNYNSGANERRSNLTMALSANRRMTLEEYLNYEDGTDIRYEVHDGVLVEMGAESDVNVLIATFLLAMFL